MSAVSRYAELFSNALILSSTSNSMVSCIQDSPASESPVMVGMVDSPSSSPLSFKPLHEVNFPSLSRASGGLPSKMLSDHVYSPQEPQDIHEQTLGPNICTEISSNTQQPADTYGFSERSLSNVNSRVNPSVCATTDNFDVAKRQTTGQHMPNCSPSDHQLTDSGDSPTDNKSSIPSESNVYSGLVVDGGLAAMAGSSVPNMPQSQVPVHQCDPVSSPPAPISQWQPILSRLVTDSRPHEPSLLPLEILGPNKNSSDDCLQLTVTPHLSEPRATLSLSPFPKSSHALYNAFNNNTAGPEPELPTDETLISHAEHSACSHENMPTDFAPDCSRIPFSSQIKYTEEVLGSHSFRGRSPDLEMQEIGDPTPSPPLSPSMGSAYLPSSSPIPSSSPVGPHFQTPPTSPPSSPVKDTQLETNNELLIHRKFKNIIPLSGFADQHIQRISPDVPTLPLQHHASTLSPPDWHCVEPPGVTVTVAENSILTTTTMVLSDATTKKAEDETGLSKGSDIEPKQLDSNVDIHRLKFMNEIPYPKRPTIAAHRLQQKKLTQPFRSPVLAQAPKMEPKASVAVLRADTVASRSLTPKESSKTCQEYVPSFSQTLDSRVKYRTTRAATQFKSPLTAQNTLDDSSLVRLTPTIQALERKLQILKRAVKVREDVQEEVLECLVKKWSEAGREVAWEVWNLVKDNANFDGGNGNSNKGKKRAFEGSWGWEGSSDAKKQRDDEKERNWGWDVVPISGRSEEGVDENGELDSDGPKHSLGTMLVQLGVAPDTLGWNEEEGSFIDN